MKTPVRRRLYELADRYCDATGWYPFAPHLIDWMLDLHVCAARDCGVVCNAQAGNFTTSFAPGARGARLRAFTRRCLKPHRSLPDLYDAITYGESVSNLLGPRWPYFATPPEFGIRVSSQWWLETAGVGVVDPLSAPELAALVRTFPRGLFKRRALARALLADTFPEVAGGHHLQAQCVDALSRFAVERADWARRWHDRSAYPLCSRLWRLREVPKLIDDFPAEGTPDGYLGSYFRSAFWRAEAVAVLLERSGLETARPEPGVAL